MSDRRRFLRSAAMAMAAARLSMFGPSEARERAPRELAALGRAAPWINSPPLTPERLAGKVVAVDFWTYTCINWLRTLPYVRAWAQKYSEGLVVIGVHTPEFPFEHNVDNVRRAVQQMRVDYPVVIDNDYSIWRAFRNQYWPALYLVDARGRVRHHYFGEGEYDQSERAIQRLLAEAGLSAIASATAGVGSISKGIVSVQGSGLEAEADWTNLRSPETYLGSERAANFVSRGARLALNQWSLTGEWTRGARAAVLDKASGQIVCRFHARDVHLVMGPSRPGSPVRFRVSVDGQPPGAAHGLDVNESGNGAVAEQRLYQLIRQPKPIVDRTLAVEFLDGGVEAFAFTFG